MPKSTTSTPSGSSRSESLPTTSTPKPSSPRKTLPMPATRMRLLIGGLRVERHYLNGREEEPVPQDLGISEVPAGVVLQRDREMDPFFVVLFDGLDEGNLPLQRQVHDVPSSAGPEHDAATLDELDAVHGHTLERGSFLLVPQHPELADGPVQVHQLFLREGLAPLQDLPRPRVRGAHLRLLLIGESENVQDQELIYLPTVEHIARAFGSYLWIVREYDRGRKQHVLGPFHPDQHGPGLLVLTPRRELPQRLWRVCHRDEAASFYLERGVRRAEGLAKRILPVFPLPGRGVDGLDGQPVDPLAQGPGLNLDLSAQRAPATHESSQYLARWTRDLFLATPTGDIYPCMFWSL